MYSHCVQFHKVRLKLNIKKIACKIDLKIVNFRVEIMVSLSFSMIKSQFEFEEFSRNMNMLENLIFPQVRLKTIYPGPMEANRHENKHKITYK